MQISSRAMIVMRWCDNRYNTGGGAVGGGGLAMFAYITNPTATISTIFVVNWKERGREREGGMHSWHLSTLESQAKAIVSNHIVNKTPNCYWYSASSLAALSGRSLMRCDNRQQNMPHASSLISCDKLSTTETDLSPSEPGQTGWCPQ